MTDKEKMEKLVAYLGRRMYAHNQMADIGSTGEMFDEKIENAKYEECRDTLNFIDSLQEEPVSTRDKLRALSDGKQHLGWLDDARKVEEESVSEDLGEYVNELSKQFPEVSFAKLSRIAVRVSRWQRNQDTKNKLPKVINRTDLDEYAYQVAYDLSNDWAIENPTWHDVEDACKLGANWQKQQYQSTIELAEDHAMLAGMEKMKEEMMTKAKSGTVQNDNQVILDNGTYIDLDPSMQLKPSFVGLKEGDRIKVIVIKEE